LGTWGGDTNPDRDFPVYCRLVRAGQLDLRPLQSAAYSLQQVNLALAALETQQVARPLIDMSL
nr:hypothetical protein [Oscillatoria sp. Prado101]